MLYSVRSQMTASKSPSGRPLSIRLAGLTVAALALAGLGIASLEVDRTRQAPLALPPLPSITLHSDSQVANRIAVDTSSLRPGSDLVTAVDVSNSGNQAFAGVLANLVSAEPGLELSVDNVQELAANSTVRYTLHLSQALDAAPAPDQVVVSLTPTA